MKKFNVEPIKKFAGQACKYIAYGALLAFVGKTYGGGMFDVVDSTIEDNETFEVSYAGTVKAIMHSSMCSYDKEKAVAALKRNMEDEIYEAIIHIVNDDSACSYDKVKMIQRLSMD